MVRDKARVKVPIYGVQFDCFFAEILPEPGKGAWVSYQFVLIRDERGKENM